MEQLKNKVTEILKKQSTDKPPIDIEILTDEEVYEGMKALVKRKQARINDREYLKKINHKPEPVTISAELLKAEFLKRYEMAFDRKFVIDNYNEKILDLLSLYFANDSRFEQGDYSLKKSLSLTGPLGCGKSSIIKIFGVMLQEINMVQETEKRAFGIVAAGKLAQIYSTEGYIGIARYTRPFDSTYSKNAGWCVDDLGAETIGKYYGKDSNIMQEILEAVYLDGRLKGNFHVTTNFYGGQIEEFYGARVRSRMREMYNFIDFGIDAPDRRK